MIEINNLTASSLDEEFLLKVARNVLKEEKKKESNLSIALVGQGKIRELNKKYRGKNRTTDILAFPESRASSEKFRVGPVQKIQDLGEIVICLREVKKNAKRFGSVFEKELVRVLIHGILHLLGYKHEGADKKTKIMAKKEEYYLSQIKLS